MASNLQPDRWLFPIEGRPEDLSSLREGLRTGPLRLEGHDDGLGQDVCLCDARIDPSVGGVEALNAAKRVVQGLNSIFALRRGPSFKPVQLTGAIFEGRPDGSRRARPAAIGIQSSVGMVLSASDPTVRIEGVPIPSWEERYLSAAEIEPLFAEAVQFAHGGFAELYQAFDTIKRTVTPTLGDTKRGYEYLRDRRWLSEDEFTNLNATLNRRHHGLPSDPVTNGVEISLEHARYLVRQLLDRWAEEIAAGTEDGA